MKFIKSAQDEIIVSFERNRHPYAFRRMEEIGAPYEYFDYLLHLDYCLNGDYDCFVSIDHDKIFKDDVTKQTSEDLNKLKEELIEKIIEYAETVSNNVYDEYEVYHEDPDGLRMISEDNEITYLRLLVERLNEVKKELGKNTVKKTSDNNSTKKYTFPGLKR